MEVGRLGLRNMSSALGANRTMIKESGIVKSRDYTTPTELVLNHHHREEGYAKECI